jgi:nucleotide-binding universal stress UspA family protein
MMRTRCRARSAVSTPAASGLPIAPWGEVAILCATNFSPEAVAAATVAAELARLRDEELWLVFVMPAHIARTFGRTVFSTGEEALNLEAARLQKLGAVVHPTVLTGKLHRELPRFATANKIGLVVMGETHREPGLLGSSTLARVGQHLESPLWAVREPERILAWTRGERPLKVFVGVDQSRSTDVAVRWVEKLSTYGKLEVVGGHVYFPPVEYQRLGLRLPHAWNDENPELLATLHRELLAKLPSSLSPRMILRSAIGRVSDHLVALATEEQADLLVLGTHHHRALGKLFSVSEQALQIAPLSVVCVPVTNRAAEVEPTVALVDRVLIATDFSATGDRAIAWGLGILAQGGTADLVHVSPVQLSPEAERRIAEQLMARVPRETQTRGLVVNAHALVGLHPAQAIVAAAERYTSSVICLGSRVHAGLAKWVVGSTAQGVFASSNRPVLIVRTQES